MASAPRIALVDYGAGNLRSVAKALERSGLTVDVTDDLSDEELHERLAEIPSLGELAQRYLKAGGPGELAGAMEFLLESLHQRALLRYGRGELATAVADWSHVLLLAPAHRAAQQMLARARAELQSAR